MGRRREGGEVGRGEAARGRRAPGPVGEVEEHEGTVAAEEDHRVVDEAGQDLLEVEATPDVAGDPAEGLGPMQLVGQIGRGVRALDDRSERAGRGADQVEQLVGDRLVRRADRVEDAPGRVTARDRGGDLAARRAERRRSWPPDRRPRRCPGRRARRP